MCHKTIGNTQETACTLVFVIVYAWVAEELKSPGKLHIHHADMLKQCVQGDCQKDNFLLPEAKGTTEPCL